MKVTRRQFVSVVPALAFVASAEPLSAFSSEASRPWALWYRQPAKRWLEALPVGNGRVGAMVFGGVLQEVLDLNESTAWSGSPNASNVNPATRENLGRIRQLLFDGKYVEANALCREYLLGREDSYGTHLPLAKLRIDQQNVEAQPDHYRRWLDLETGRAGVEYSVGGVHFSREYFASNPDQVLVAHIAADRPGRLSFSVSLDSGELPGLVVTPDDRTIVLSGSSWEKRHSDGNLGVVFQVTARLLTEGGSAGSSGTTLVVRDANAATILIAANTSYRQTNYIDLCSEQIRIASAKGYNELEKRHLADHGPLFKRVDIDLGGQDNSTMPTDERLVAVRNGVSDPQLSALFFQYGRYLLIAGSRPNSPLPMNLQGIWNDSLAARMVWTCDFHLDINTQQNYWPSEVCNLSECGEPLFKLIESISESGRSTARDMYGASGWVCHVYTNAWGFTAPGRGLQWGPFVTGGIWTAFHLWEHYRFTRDREFLARRAYPILKSAAEFFLDYMVEDPKRHWLVTGPSISPENVFLSPDGERCCVSMGPSCDRELVYELFNACIAASTELGVDAAFRARLESARDRLAPLQIGKHGQLQEWLDDFDEGEPNHRHTSHLIALFPLDQITPDRTPELAQAARVTIGRRTGQKNWEDVEWSRSNLIHFFARLRDGEAASQHLLGLLTEDTDSNLMTFSRGGVAGAFENIFAIDGNTAGSSGVAEMLLQSHDAIHLLPALPKAWRNGSIRGLRARGGFEVDIQWRNGVLTSGTVHSDLGGKCRVRYGDRVVPLEVHRGGSARFDQNLSRLGS